MPAGPHPHTRDKKDFHAHNVFFLYLTQTAKHRANFHSLGRLGWALSPPKEGNVYWGTDLNGVSKWCLRACDLGTAGKQFSDLSGSTGESQGCSFPHNMIQGDGLKPGLSVPLLTVVPRNKLTFLHYPAAWVCMEYWNYWHTGQMSPPGTCPASLHPPGMELSSTIACEPHLRLPEVFQGMLEVRALNSRPQDLADEGLPSAIFLPHLTAPLLLSQMCTKKVMKEAIRVLGTTWPMLLSSVTRDGVRSYTTWIQFTKRCLSAFWSQWGVLKWRHFSHQFLRCISPWDPWYGWTGFLIYV